MRILIVADIHSNWQALAAIDEQFDACLFLGDLVDYGTEPSPCVEWVRSQATHAIRGNHDHAVAQRIPARGGQGFKALTAATRPIHWQQLDLQQMQFLGQLPVTKRFELGDLSFLLVHATPRDPMDEYLTHDVEAWRERLEGIEADFVCVGHTHIPIHLELENIQVLNPGSVGQPRDGDPRCSYALIDNGRVSLRRVEYDIDAAVQQMRTSGLDEPELSLAESVLRSGGSH
jgi:putative phosphoesterase